MLKEESEVFLQLDRDAEERVLIPGTVVELDDQMFMGAFVDEGMEVEIDQEIMVYFNLNNKFVCQIARIASLPDLGDVLVEDDADAETPVRHIVVEITSADIQIAESRQCFRVSTSMANIRVTFGKQDECLLADVSSTGFAVISPEFHQVGSDVKVDVDYEGHAGSGYARVRSSRKLNDGSYRYGAHCVDDSLEDAIHNISMEVQRAQMARMAGV